MIKKKNPERKDKILIVFQEWLFSTCIRYIVLKCTKNKRTNLDSFSNITTNIFYQNSHNKCIEI